MSIARHWKKAATAAALALLGALAACDNQAIKELEEGVSTEADVVQRFGQPERVWPEPDGSKTYEYNRQPEGTQNYMITIGTDGRMSALRQVLNPHNFARVQPGMTMEQVRQMLGKPARQVPYKLKNEIDWSWRFLDTAANEKKMFFVTFSPDYRVIRTEIGRDLDGPDMRGGG
ncbi:MAG: outer membrane protein assembly factor BamE [Ottowia sp.]|uniref:outer membrane protein assembly factor BamE domain-containing protein n=1 Tax=Ottowia sp. TaxID=1898956 RepID=UPI001D769473|nr:outer membrane protein assembly factor BamE [Ottowia sp.]MCP5256973.1 outer membrane protein assembly factor BamE [Burkholderiaceae bacterium]MCB2025693.1 outer membrane protein assembly factor BamE [Ottowia sp.]MCB2033760.1 outer membrane protein assembly factor BamE [Ottowia sp.]MCB2037304.1 outer membrane protein assembly factor BamE [Ottowia sp.]MCB2069751.1 outer membrane protein assembly factor BamE [Ottowia sp.]